jgi:hypothetical protein
MATNIYYFSGTAKFPRLGSTDDWGNYSIGVILDPPSQAEFDVSGLRLQPREYDGDTFITFRRPDSKPIKGEIVKFGAPKVIDAAGTPVTALVGNGSKVTVKVAVYDSLKGKGHRLDTVRVDELVEYKPQPQMAAQATTEAPRRQMPF